MNILITGAGLIGCSLAWEMSRRGHRVVLYDLAPIESYVRSMAGEVPVIKGDVRDLPALIDAMRANQAEVVFHSAGLIGPKVGERPYTGLGINVGGATAVGEAARLSGVRRVIFASSFAVYNWTLPSLVPIHEDFPTSQNNFYGCSKIACEQILRAYASTYSMELAIVRFAQVYGRGHYVGGSPGGMAVHEVAAAAARGEPVRIKPSLFGVNEFVYVKDAVQGVALACEKPLTVAAFNIGTGKLSSPSEVAEAIRAVSPGLSVEVLPVPAERPGQHRGQPLDLSRAARDLGYAPQFDLNAGMAAFVQDIRENSA
ncbi:MAG: NAD(P)-dependent oxidoreductase [Dehalococcoidia bacterium]|nr:NAD(P)-dependent oxidoreductase [Dehalococcoidia bacterium]